jgi:signal transduction histidine kinase/CHASE1-domain containing sensor protein
MSTVLRDAFSVTRFSFWTGLLLSSVVGALAYTVTERSIESDAHGRFINHAKYAQSVIGTRIKSYADLLRGSASAMQSSDNMTQALFHDYVQGLNLPRDYPALDFINFAVYVRPDEREAFVRQLRAEKSFLGQRAAKLDISPPGNRPAYLSVAYIEPHAQVPALYGFDLMTNRYFGDMLSRERDEGKMQASGTPIPVLSHPNEIYLGLRMPVYRLGAPVDNVEQRRAAYRGSMGIAFNVTMLLRSVIDEIALSPLRMTLYDVGQHVHDEPGDPSGNAYTLFDTLGTVNNNRPPLDTGPDVFSVTLPLDFNGRPWKTIYSVHKSALYTGFDVYYPKLMMAFSFIGTMLLYALLYTLTSSRRAALALAQEMTSELRESQSKLQLAHQKLRRLADHAYQIKELERKRIAREIHDDLGQNLLALRIEGEMLASRTRGTHSRLHARARATLQQIDTIIKSVRQIINDLRPTVLDLGLSAAVEWQVNQFQRRTGIQCEVHDENGEIALPDHCATAFFRILQESLTNVVRHANATRVVVELRLNAGWLSMTIKDNGCGLPPGGRNKFGSFGLVGIEERIVILGGTCAVFSEPGGGTTVVVSAPVMDTPHHPLQSQQEHRAGSAVI